MRVLVVEDIPRHTILRAAGIELDQLTGTITREGRIIKLAAKERAVLQALLKTPLHSASPPPMPAALPATMHGFRVYFGNRAQITLFCAAVSEKRRSCQAAHNGGYARGHARDSGCSP